MNLHELQFSISNVTKRFVMHESNVLLCMNPQISMLFHEIFQSGFQSGLETAPLAAVRAGYCHLFGQFQINVNLNG